MTENLEQQFAFLQEIDKLKQITRATEITGGSRKENSGEHSWHIAMYALILAEHAAPDVDINRVIKMLLIHDLVEIDAGDVPIHQQIDVEAHEAKERAAAKRIFGMLPQDQAEALHDLWTEFEASVTPDAIFAKSIDRVQPVLLNIANGGGSWTDYNVTLEQLEHRVGQKVARGSRSIWQFVRQKAVQFFETV
ncbi:HD domain-containing protein [Cochlodiniinecator piscidefendens]|uniref:HD domain-containing protein n=1 Tax=Cochlodiniinecator piscidefendens TaxID=2715756 RepID=UPI00140D11B0|nr:HD domain-containing protein [Cochlodiniinecator piscidefendens]